MVGREPVLVPDPLLPSTELTLGGLVFASIFNLGDRRKNHVDLLTAFLLAFRDREDATLVIKLATNPTREHHEINVLRHMYMSLGITHKCRIAVITEFLTDRQMADLMRVTTFYVNTSKAEGACLPLQQSLAAGRPSIAPGHTAMADFMDEQVGFVIRTHPEPTYWPHDPEMRTETSWQSDGLVGPPRPPAGRRRDGRGLARSVPRQGRGRPSPDGRIRRPRGRRRALREALARLPDIRTGRFAWAS